METIIRKPELHLITDAAIESSDLIRRVEAAAKHGVDIVQLRLHGAPARLWYETAVALQSSLKGTSTQLFINDRLDVALTTGAAGVHLGRRSLPLGAAKAILPSQVPVGVSVHCREEARLAALQGADYLTFGHVYETSSHPAHAPRGLDLLACIVKVAPIPVIAIGGITPKRVPEILATGALGIAVMSGILQAAEPAVAAQTFRAALDEQGGTSTV